MGSERLSAEAWVEAAFAVLATGGVDAVRVEPLAARLGVTKGSFYWHFTDRRGLLDAVLETWERQATAAVIEYVDARGQSPKARLELLVRVTSGIDERAAVEHAIRAWGATDASVRKRVAKVDAAREGYVRALLEASGLTRARAAARARLLYLTLIGEFTWVSLGGAPSGKALWDEALALLTRGS